MKKSMVALSGGMDSAALLAHVLDLGEEVVPIKFMYGSKHETYETPRASDLACHYKVQGLLCINIRGAFCHSSPLMGKGEIPDGHHNDSSMKTTVVPGRNLIFISTMAGLAQEFDCRKIYIGCHGADEGESIYPDCRLSFLQTMRSAVLQATDNQVSLEFPFANGTKRSVLERGLELNVPFEMTRTCYKDQSVACGKCGACTHRLEAFKEVGMQDPLLYEKEDNND